MNGFGEREADVSSACADMAREGEVGTEPWGLERVVGAQVVILCPLLTSSAQSHAGQGQEHGSWCVSAPTEKGLRI